MTQIGQKSITLIMARELAANLATPLFVVDPEGTLVFYNEPAEEILGRSFNETGELKAAAWADLWNPTDLEGKRLSMRATPIGVALMDKKPAHMKLRISSLDGTSRVIEASAFPLLAHADEFSGAMAVFWEDAETE